jgi:hypothetical protein
MLRVAAIVALLLSTYLWAGPAIMRADIFDGDAAHHVFWLYQYADPTLFPNDITVRYLRTSAPLGYRVLYALIAPHADVLSACEVLSAVLAMLTGLLAWMTAAGVSDDEDSSLRGLLGVGAYVVLLACSTNIDLMPAMAFQRTFAFPLLLMCMYGLVSHRYGWVGASWIGAALFYPVVLPVAGLGAAVVFLRDMVTTRRMPDLWIINGVCGITALVLAVFCIPSAPELGPAYTFSQAVQMPEYGPHGRLQLFLEGSWTGNYLRFHMMGMGWGPFHLACIGTAVIVAWLLGQRRLLPFAAWTLPGVGFALWLVMRLFPEKLMFGLYLPNRHTRWSYGAFAIIAGAAGSFAVLNSVRQRWSEKTLTYLLAVLVPVLALVLTFPHYRELMAQPIDTDLEKTYTYLASLPKNTLIAGHPDITSYIPLRSHRSVLAATETSMPWLEHYYAVVKPRVEASLRAAYAPDVATMDSELRAYHPDVFVVGPPAWTMTRYLDPYDAMVQPLLVKGRREGFGLQRPPADRILFRSGEYYVLRVSR